MPWRSRVPDARICSGGKTSSSCSAQAGTSPASINPRGEEEAQPLDRRKPYPARSGEMVRKREGAPGSWWPRWREWLGTHGGGKRKPRRRPRQREVQADRARPGPIRERQRVDLNSRRRHHEKRSTSSAPPAPPIGKFGGTLAKTPASDLGALVIRKVLERAGVQAGTGVRSDPRPGAHRGRRPEPGAPGGDQGGHSGHGAGDDDQQGVRLGPARRRCSARRRSRNGDSDIVVAGGQEIDEPRRRTR